MSICIECKICKDKYRLRYNLGNKYPQSATFICDDCGEKLTIGVDDDQNFILEGIEQIEPDRNLKVVNLHPELPLDADSKNNPYYFPSLISINRQNKKGIDGFVAFRNAQESCIAYQHYWDNISKDFRYLKEKRWKFLYKEYGENENLIEIEVLLRIFFTADYFLEGVWKQLLFKVETEFFKVKKHPKFEELRKYLLFSREDILFNKMFNVMNRYREVETMLLPTLLDQKCGFKPNGISSTIQWEEIKHIYGTFFEIYGDILVIPTIMNNLLERDAFNQFASENFSLQNFVESDKAGRCKNFLINQNLVALSEFYDSGIRNGTYHESCSFDKETQLIILKTGKGGKNVRQIPLIEYIEHCNEIYARLLILFRIYFKIIA